MSPKTHADASELEAGHSQPFSEKEQLLGPRHHHNTPPTDRHLQAPKENMPSARHLMLVLVLSLMAAIGVASATVPAVRRPWPCRSGSEGTDSASRIVDDAKPQSLHNLLHKYFPDRFKDGVWASDESAVEAVSQDDAELASSIAQLAKRDTNTTAPPSSTTDDPNTDPPTTSPTSSPGDDTTSDPPPTSTGDSESPTPTDSETSPPPPTTQPTEPTSHTSVPPTTSPGTSTGLLPSSTGPSPSVTSQPTSSVGPSSHPTFVTASHPSHSGKPSKSHGEPTKTSSPPPSTEKSRLTTATYTSTNADGGLVVVTATSYVPGGAGETEGASKTKPSGSLQTNAAPLKYGRHNILEAVAAGAVVGGALLI